MGFEGILPIVNIYKKIVLETEKFLERSFFDGFKEKELTEGDAVTVYEGERDQENDALVMERYEKAVEACRIWLRAVIGAEVISNSIELSLYFSVVFRVRKLFPKVMEYLALKLFLLYKRS